MKKPFSKLPFFIDEPNYYEEDVRTQGLSESENGYCLLDFNDDYLDLDNDTPENALELDREYITEACNNYARAVELLQLSLNKITDDNPLGKEIKEFLYERTDRT